MDISILYCCGRGVSIPIPSPVNNWIEPNKMAIKRNKYLNCLNLIVGDKSHEYDHHGGGGGGD